MINEGFDHEAIMNALTQPHGQYPETITHPHISCLYIKGSLQKPWTDDDDYDYNYDDDDYSDDSDGDDKEKVMELQNIADKLKDRYGTPKIDDSHANFPEIVQESSEIGQFSMMTPSSSNSEVVHSSAEDTNRTFDRFLESEEQNNSKTALLQSTMNCILDTIQSNSRKDDGYKFTFHCGSEYLGRIVNDTCLTSLSLENTAMTSDWLFNFAKHLPRSQIASLVLPRIIDNNSQAGDNQNEISSKKLRKKPRTTPVNTSSNEKVQKNGLEYLTSILKDTQLSSLDFGGNPINLKMLSCSLIGTKITCLGLRGCKLQNDGLNCFARILKDTQITSIDLSNNKLDCESLNIFLAGLEGTNIMSLNLSSNRIGVDGMNYLGSVLKNIPITSLDISNNNLNHNSLEVFLNCLVGSKLSSLSLENNDIGVNGLICLGTVLKNTQITSLNISCIGLNFESLKVFAPCLVETKITSLGLRGNRIDIDGLDILSKVLKNTQITSINLYDNNWDFDDNNLENINSLERVLTNPQITLIDIDIFGCFNRLASSLVGSNITHIGLKQQISSNDELEFLGNILKDSNITSVDLSCNGLEDESLKIFVPFLVNSKINSLDLSENHFCYEGINDLGNVLKKTQITSLNLSSCYLNCNCMTNFVIYLPGTRITSLNLRGNDICCNYFYLASILKHTQITTLDLGSYKFSKCNLDPISFLQLFSDNITSLELIERNLCSFSWYYFACNLRNTKIDSLKITGDEIECDGLKYLSQGLVNSQVVELDLSYNKINCSGAYYLAQVLRHTRITSLNLSGNEISCKGLKYLTHGLEGSLLKSLDLFRNSINNEGIQGLAESLVGTQIEKLDLRDNKIGRDAVYHLSERVGQSEVNSMLIKISIEDFYAGLYLFKYQNCFIEINETTTRAVGLGNFIKKFYKTNGITQLFLKGYAFPDLAGSFDNMNIIETVFVSDEFNVKRDSNVVCLASSNIGELKIDWYELSSNSFEKMNVIALTLFSSDGPRSVANYYADTLKLSLMKCNIAYLDLSNNAIGYYELEDLVAVLPGSQIISLNLSRNFVNQNCIQLLARVLPNTKLSYIDLHCNSIGFLGFKNLMNVVDNTKLCWLSLGNNDIEKDLEEDIELSPYIVPRIDNPIEFQIRYLFRELVSMNTTSGQFEFVIPRKDYSSIGLTMNHYPRLVKHLLDTPIYKMHIYDYFYMLSKKHDIHLLNRINVFLENIKQNFLSFFENKILEFEEKFSCDSFVSLVKECDHLNLTDFVEFLLLHRVLYYVDNEQNFLHPFIYKMLHKYQLPLYKEDMEPNKKQQIISYFEEHSDIDGAREIIDLLKVDRR